MDPRELDNSSQDRPESAPVLMKRLVHGTCIKHILPTALTLKPGLSK